MGVAEWCRQCLDALQEAMGLPPPLDPAWIGLPSKLRIRLSYIRLEHVFSLPGPGAFVLALLGINPAGKHQDLAVLWRLPCKIGRAEPADLT